MGFHHNWTILVKNLHSEEVKSSKPKRFSLNFLTSFNVNYSCYGRMQIISVQDTGCEVFTVLGLALNHTSDMFCQGLEGTKDLPVPAQFPWGFAPPCPWPRSPCQSPGALSPCPSDMGAGLVSSPPKPCPARSRGHKRKELNFFQVKVMLPCPINALMRYTFNRLGFLAGSQPLCYGGYTEISELAAGLRQLVRSIFITTLIVGKKETGLENESALPGAQEEASSS